MAEYMSSLRGPRQQPHTGNQSPENPLDVQEVIGKLAHDIRGPLTTVLAALKVMESSASDTLQWKTCADILNEAISQIQQLLNDAVDNAPLPKCSLSDAYNMIQDALKAKIKEYTLSPESHDCTYILEHCSPGGYRESLDKKGPDFRIVLEDVPEDMRNTEIRFAPCAASSIVANTVNNARRAGAKSVCFRFKKPKDTNAVELLICDDGEGMHTSILEKLRKGECVTNKPQKDGHGFGVMNVRTYVEKKAGGAMYVYSVPIPDESNPDDEPVDQASKLEHPHMHGTTFKLVFPAKVPQPAGDVLEPSSYNPDQYGNIVAATGRIKRGQVSRREMFRTVAAGAATAGGLIGLHVALTRETSRDPHEVVREIPSSPLTDIQTDNDGRLLSFTYKMMGVEAEYRYGENLPRSIRDVQVLPLPEGGSLAVIVPASINGTRISPMYLCTTTAGVWGHALTETVKTEDGMRTAFLCAARGGADEGVPYQPDLYPMEDALFNTRLHKEIERIIGGAQEPKQRYHATSEKLYESPAFREMLPLLMSAARALPAQTQRGGGARFNVFSAHLLKCLNIALIRDQHPVKVRDVLELQSAILTGARFIILDEPFVGSLRRTPLNPHLTRMAFDRGDSICLPNVSQKEVPSLLPLS